MADTKISALTAATTAAATNEFAINEAGASKRLTAALLKTFCNPTIITGASGTVDATAIGRQTIQVLTSDNADIPSNSLVTQLTAVGMNAGWWLCEFWISWESNVTTTGITFHLDHTGTATPFIATREDPTSSATALATVGVADQDSPTGTGVGWLPSNFSVRADATNLGPNAGVDTINAPQFSRVTALILVTGNGDLTFRAASEIVSTITRINAGTVARYTRLS